MPVTDDRSRRRWVLVVLLACVLAILLWPYAKRLAGVRSGAPETPGSGASANSKFPTIAASGAASGAPSITRRNQPAPDEKPRLPAPLPPLNTRVVDVLAQLKDAADHGDARAACRVGAELAQCFRTVWFAANTEEMARDAVKNPDPKETAAILKVADAERISLAPELARCEGVSDVDRNEAWSYLAQAASAGNAAAAATFYTGPPTEYFKQNSDVLDFWLEHREEYRDMAIAAGDLYALHQAGGEASMGVGWGGRSREFPKDPALAVTYDTAILPLLADNNAAGKQMALERLAKSMTPAEFEAAQKAGEALRARYFANVQPISNVNRVATFRPERCAD